MAIMYRMTHRELRITLPPGLPKDRYSGVKDAVSSLLGLWDIPVSCLESIEDDPEQADPD